MRYAESEALLRDARITETHLRPVDEFLAEAKMDWPLTAVAVSQHTGTPISKVRLVFDALVNGGWFLKTESFLCAGDSCTFVTPRAAVEQARDDKDECLCDGCDQDLAGHEDLQVVQVYRSCGQPLDNG